MFVRFSFTLFLFSFQSAEDQHYFQSRKLLKKDTPLGTLSLDLTQLPDNILIDSWYKLQVRFSKTNECVHSIVCSIFVFFFEFQEVSSGELRLLLRFTPMMLPQNKKEHVNQRLPMFRLVPLSFFSI
jgi:hypothetical protein